MPSEFQELVKGAREFSLIFIDGDDKRAKNAEFLQEVSKTLMMMADGMIPLNALSIDDPEFARFLGAAISCAMADFMDWKAGPAS